MTHRLERPDEPRNPILSPLTVSLRYRCECATNEVLTIQTVLPREMAEEEFVWTMRALWRDMQTEIRQHVGRARDDQAP